jgi:predicted ATP-grasp superfamily ATP-dependent carboligase
MQMTLLAIIVGLVIAMPLTLDEQNVLGNFLFAAGEVILVIAAQRTLINGAEKAAAAQIDTNKINTKLKDLEQQIDKLKNQGKRTTT